MSTSSNPSGPAGSWVGADPDASVVNPQQRFWGIPNLYAMDGSVFPISGGRRYDRGAEGIARGDGHRAG